MSYLYIAGIVAYYLYKAYANNKKKQQENAESIPSAQQPTKKKKGFFDEFLEELEKHNQAPEQTSPKEETVVVKTPMRTAPREETVVRSPTRNVQKEEPAINKIPRKLTQAKKSASPIFSEEIAKPINKYFDIPPSEIDAEIGNTDIESILQESDQPKSRKRFAGMDITPKQALKSQIILEKKF
ncbi:MAG TPA: hypothetical protein VLZ75_01710 [Chitinophagales bacterium]|nr:hypothetical protein [Chitinophagales bacterium]